MPRVPRALFGAYSDGFALASSEQNARVELNLREFEIVGESGITNLNKKVLTSESL